MYFLQKIFFSSSFHFAPTKLALLTKFLDVFGGAAFDDDDDVAGVGVFANL